MTLVSPLAEGSSPQEEPDSSAPEHSAAAGVPGVPQPRQESVDGADASGASDASDAMDAMDAPRPAPGVVPAGIPEAAQIPEITGIPEVAADAADDKRRYPSTIGGACYLVVLAVTIVGLAIAGAGHWRGGVHCIAGALLTGAILRFVLPQRDAGMLAVRTRWIDCTLLAALGVLLWVLASTLPNG